MHRGDGVPGTTAVSFGSKHLWLIAGDLPAHDTTLPSAGSAGSELCPSAT